MRALLLFTGVALWALATPGAQAPPRPAEAPQFVSAASELVVLPVTVTDKQGRFVPELPSGRFTVYDNGRPQPIALFSNEDTPVTIGLVLDDSGSMRRKIGDVIVASLALARLSNPRDELFAVKFNDTARDLMPDRALVASDIAGLQQTLRSALVPPQGRTALYSALVVALDRLERAAHPRRVLVVVSDGGDNGSRATLEEVLARARRSNVTIYTIGLFTSGDSDANPGVLKTLARATGGERFLPKSGGPLVQVCESIAREIRHMYSVAYVPPDRDGTYHRVRVRVAAGDRGRLTVRTRPGYFAAAPRRTSR